MKKILEHIFDTPKHITENSRKLRKILRRVWSAPKHIFETFCTREAPRCIGMNATLATFYLIRKIKQGFFLYYISCKEKKMLRKI
jgi:hypothetical protein